MFFTVNIFECIEFIFNIKRSYYNPKKIRIESKCSIVKSYIGIKNTSK